MTKIEIIRRLSVARLSDIEIATFIGSDLYAVRRVLRHGYWNGETLYERRSRYQCARATTKTKSGGLM